MKAASSRVRVGVVGVGTMGQHHVRVASQNPDVELVGFYDPDAGRCVEISRRHGCECLASVDGLLDEVDALMIAAPTSLHEELGMKCLEHGVHLLMEKPLAHSLEAAARLVDRARAAGVVLMVGHIERYNPAVAKLFEVLNNPLEKIITIDARRLSPFDGTRCLDVDVLLDLLIHDVDLALEIAGSPVVRVSAAGRAVFSGTTDMAHTRIEFQNDAVAGFWTARCSPMRERRLTVTTPTRCLVADTMSRSLTVFAAGEVTQTPNGSPQSGAIRTVEVPVPDEEPLRRELEDFFRSVREGTKPLVDGERALRAMMVLDLVRKSVDSGHEVTDAGEAGC